MGRILPRLVFAFGCLLAAAACSAPTGPSSDAPRTGQSAPAAPGPAPREIDPDRPLILAFGDSLTAGNMVEGALAYPSQLQAKLDEAGYDYQVVNDGEGGLTTSGGLARLDRALALAPDIVILELGGNDGLRGTPTEVIRANLRTLATRFRQAGAVVVLAGLTLPRNYGPDYIGEFEQVYAELARELDVTHIPFFLEGLVDLDDPEASIGVTMQADGIHPTGRGYAIVAETVFRAIEPHLEK